MKKLSLLAAVILLVAAGTAQGAETLLTAFQSAGWTQTINGAIFTNINPQTTGTGYIDPFLKFTANGSSVGGADTEQAYNYDSKGVTEGYGNDAYGSDNWTRLIRSDGLAVTTIGGVDYWTFILDIDQTGSESFYSLNQLKLFYSPSNSLNPAVPSFNCGSAPNLGTMFYNMDANCGNADVALGLNYRLNPGSGAGDLMVQIPVPSLATPQYIYLYHAGGFTGGNYINNDGPDEWWVKEGPSRVPDPGSSMILLCSGLITLGVAARRWRK